MAQDTASSPVTDLPEFEIPYASSWIDRLIQWISRIPGPAWLIYVAALLAFALLNNAVFWLDGSLAAGSFDRIRVLDSGFIVYFVALYHHLSLVAGRSFQDFRPVLKTADSDIRILEYRLTTFPRQLGWLAILVGIGLGIVSVQSDPGSYGLDVAMTLLPVVYQSAAQIFVISALVALILQIIRQLRLVIDLHRQAAEIDLFQLAPVHAFASLTARAGIGLVVFMVFNGLLEYSEITGAPLYVMVIVGGLAIFVFVMPLLGMRNRLKAEKARLLSVTNEALKVTIGRIHDQVNSNQQEDIAGLNTAMNALIVERNLIEGISTWPWEPSTLRGFASTLLLPIFLWLVTRLLERLI
ncbi:MAG TPA: hypothetical protein VI755_05790 [Anaerolineales bacterium]|nr:hypothetical protein [Anaerolineales bacterium]